MTKPGYHNISLTQEDREALMAIWEVTLKPLGINYSSAAMVRYLIKYHKQNSYKQKGKR